MLTPKVRKAEAVFREMRDSIHRLAFVTCRDLNGLTEDDQLAAAALARRGFEVEAVVWDDPRADWTRYDRAILRSNWDYHLRPALFERWVRGFSDAPARLWNPPEAVLANLNKKYLLDLERQGIEIVPTIYAKTGEDADLGRIREARGWDRVVVKPAISASAWGAWLGGRDAAEADRTRFAAQLRQMDLLVQPYMAEIAEGGEWSIVFFAGEFSHAVRKRPRPGDYRVQEEYGGESLPDEPGARLIAEAGKVLTGVDAPLLYARVDGVERDGRFILMELEINEPALFFSAAPRAADRFAEAVRRLPEEKR